MKKTALILSLCLCALSVKANDTATTGTSGIGFQKEHRGTPTQTQIGYDDIRILRTGDFVEVSFSVTAGAKSVARGEQLVLTPVLYNENRQVSLPRIAVQSRRARLQEFRAGDPYAGLGVGPVALGTALQLTPGGAPLRYSAVVPYDTTLTNLLLRIERKQEACGHIHTLPVLALTDRAALVPEPKALPLPAKEDLADYSFGIPVTSVAEAMSGEYGFVAPVEDFERSKQLPDNRLFDADMTLNMGDSDPGSRQSEVDLFLAANEKGAMQIDFERNSTRIYRYYKENNASLVTLASVLKKIERSEDSRVTKIIVAGFASPEGSLAANDRLAVGRAESVRDFIRANSGIPADNIMLYNGSEDWNGLRRMILSSDIEHKEKLLDIIDRVPVLAGREGQLMRVAGGDPYRYMAQHFFPKLRNAAYIKVYYEITPEATLLSDNLRHAVAQMHGGDFAGALETLTALPEIPGGGVENLMGVCCMMTGERAKADEYFRKAAANGNADAVLNLERLDPAPSADGQTKP